MLRQPTQYKILCRGLYFIYSLNGGIIRVEYVKSGEQHADVLTKAIDAKSFEKHARFLLNVR